MNSGQDISIRTVLVRIWPHLDKKRRIQLSFLVVLTLVASLSELLSIGSVLPFLSVLTMPEIVFQYPLAEPLISSMGIDEPAQLIAPLAILFSMAALMAGAMRLLLLWVGTRVSFACGADLSIEMYRKTLHQPYAVHMSRNSGDVISAIHGKSSALVTQAIRPALNLISTFIMLLVILPALMILDPVIGLSTFLGFGSLYLLLIQLTKHRQQLDSARIASESNRRLRTLQEGLGGIRDVLLDGTQEAYSRVYRDADIAMRRAQGNAMIVGESPRFLVESLGMVLVAGLAVLLSQRSEGVAPVIPVLGTFVFGAQRLLPILQLTYYSVVNLRTGKSSVIDALELLEQPSYPASQVKPRPMSFRGSIGLRNVSFRYQPESPFVLENVNLEIRKGSRVGFIGKTGSGKSTLIDLISGLLQPTEGGLTVDGVPIDASNQRAWQARIAHVPQEIFLTDASFAENIALGRALDEIDLDRVKRVAVQAQLSEVIESTPKGYATLVGERGVRLSGGQRQRIGIARALYKSAELIIFDEATSSLDTETEHLVMQSIERLSNDLTILIIAHRLTTLRNCDRIYEVRNGSILSRGTYADSMISRAP